MARRLTAAGATAEELEKMFLFTPPESRTEELRIYFAEEELLHDPVYELGSGKAIAARDVPQRVSEILRVLESEKIGRVVTPERFSEDVFLRVHSRELIEFLKTLHGRWTAEFPDSRPYPETAMAPGMTRVRPSALRGQLAYHCFDTATPVLEHTWEAVRRSSDAAIAGMHGLLGGDRFAFALSRPPGHHAGRDFYGGYCFLNHAAIAAQVWADRGGGRCAVLDVDFHHGNGTQEIFYERADVLFASLHGDPAETYPFFSGFAAETGGEKGLGYNVNVPLAPGTSWVEYEPALATVLERIARYKPEVVVASLGVDTARGDPTGSFRLETDDFRRMGKMIRLLERPTLVVMEGGYGLEDVGRNVASFLRGLLE